MTSSSDKYEVGYGRTPLHSRWKKGQSGNARKHSPRTEGSADMLDRLLLATVELKLNGEIKRVSALEAIVSQLQLKEISGDTRASRVLSKYKDFANQHIDRPPEVRFCPRTADDREPHYE